MNTYTQFQYSFLFMPGWIQDVILNIVLSIIIIFVFQSAWNYLKDTYTTKKTKDVVNTQIRKYKDMFEKLKIPSSPFQNEKEKQSMNQELLNYVNQELIHGSEKQFIETT
jgi:hypothetical protein